ncbi:MAG: hypothetical protein KDJ38_03280 [Gammaproteobacteria bacterium]|nr:hypothetical protein [Gammaproteobacteria bacterium]
MSPASASQPPPPANLIADQQAAGENAATEGAGNPEIAGLISRHHYKSPDYKTVLKKTISAEILKHYLADLDPYSRLISAEQVRFNENRAKYRRIGPGLDYLIDRDKVLGVPVFDGPLYKQGLKNAIRIEHINDQVIDYDEFDSYRFLDDFSEGDRVIISYRHNDTAALETLSLQAASYQYEPARFYRLGKTAVLEIRRFRTGKNRLIRDALQNAADAERLVLDLRFSPGGDIYAMTDWLSLFLPEGMEVARLRRQNDLAPLVLKTLSGRVNLPVPVVILVSRFTASSAEIFARVLAASLPSALTIGEHTRGKCLAQNTFRLSNGDSLSLSTYEVELAGGLCNNTSLQPNVEIPGVEYSNLADLLDKF